MSNGDSLTFLGPDEHINVIFRFGDETRYLRTGEDAGPAQEVMTVRKSVITEFKAGRLTMEGLKQRIPIY